MVGEIVLYVLSDNSGKITAAPPPEEPKKKSTTSAKPGKKKTTNKTSTEKKPKEQLLSCPVCHTGHIIQGKTAYGCSRWKEGCGFRLPFDKAGNPLDEETLQKRIQDYNPNTHLNHE